MIKKIIVSFVGIFGIIVYITSCIGLYVWLKGWAIPFIVLLTIYMIWAITIMIEEINNVLSAEKENFKKDDKK